MSNEKWVFHVERNEHNQVVIRARTNYKTLSVIIVCMTVGFFK